MQSVLRIVLYLGALGLVAPACGAGRGADGFVTGGSSGAGGGGGSRTGSGSSSGGGSFSTDGGGGTGGFGDGAVAPPASNGCSGAATDFVYVLSVENDLYSFAPQ